jgi:hypothetical protein
MTLGQLRTEINKLIVLDGLSEDRIVCKYTGSDSFGRPCYVELEGIFGLHRDTHWSQKTFNWEPPQDLLVIS